MTEKNVSLVCVGCGYENKGPESLAGSTCPECGQQVLNVKNRTLSNWATRAFGRSKKKK